MSIPALSVSLKNTGTLLYQVIKLVFYFHISRYTNNGIAVIKQYPDFLKMPTFLDSYFHCSTLTPSGFSLYPQHSDKSVFSDTNEDLQLFKYSQNLTHYFHL